jgi:CRISPR-associated protein Csm3
MTDIRLYGRIFISTYIEAVTGLHIGGSSAGLEIGGVDKIVVRNALTNRPYIPGSSLRGKMRSQTEKVLGLRQNNPIGQVTIHTCKRSEEYNANGGCVVCHIYGVPGEADAAGPTLLLVRDALLTDDSADKLQQAKTDLPYAELKTEVAIDRVTSAATPRTLERVPAGAVFGPAELVFSIYSAADFSRLRYVIEALQLVEDDYLGGSGSRGSGKVKFSQLAVSARTSNAYSQKVDFRTFNTLQELSAALGELAAWAEKTIPVG